MTQRESNTFIQTGCRLYILAALFLCSFALVFARIQADHFWDEGVRVEGVVLTVDAKTSNTKSGRKRIDSESVVFKYLVDGQALQHRQYFSYDTPFFIGQKVPVIYLPNTPWVAEIHPDTPDDSYSLLAIGFGLLLAIVFGAFIFGAMQSDPRKKQKRKPHEEGIYDQTTL